ncbi:MAG: FAD-dependent oxidoreductase [Stellaceae bacterium]
MFIDGRGIPPDSIIDSDICIIGAGAAGIALARQFAASDLRVCLLESGGLDADAAAQALAEGDSVGTLYSPLEAAQLRFFGGNTNAWGGWFRGFDDIDFRPRAWVEASGWPFDGRALAPYAERVQAICDVPWGDDGDQSLAAIANPRARLIPFDPARVESAFYRFSPPTRFGRVYRRQIKRSRAITCVINAHALKVETTPDTRRVTGIEVGCLAGSRLKVTGRVFILAAGAIENARLLLLSNDRAPAGLGNAHDQVGRYFMDHPHTRRALLPGPRQFPFGLYGLAFRDRGVAAGLSITAAAQRVEKMLNYKASIYPIFYGEGSPSWEGFRNFALKLSRKWGADPYDRGRLPFVPKTTGPRQVAAMLGRPDKVVLGALAQASKSERLASGLVLESRLEQAPNRASRVTLQDGRDAFGLPRARVDWRLLPIDRHSALRAEDIIDAELQRIGIGRLAPLAPEERDQWPAEFAGGWHQIGTTRIHADPRCGVVDANCQVHGVGNLFIAGASVFPTGGSVSPMPTLLALALRLADHVQEILRRPLAGSSRPAPARAMGSVGSGGGQDAG